MIVKTNAKKTLLADIRVITLTIRSLTGEEEHYGFKRIEKECQRLAQDPPYYDDKTAK